MTILFSLAVSALLLTSASSDGAAVLQATGGSLSALP